MQPVAPSDPQPSFATVAGYEVAYSAEGATDGPVVVAVPGLPGSARDFRWLAPALTAWARVVRFDPPGFGASPRPHYAAMSAEQKAAVVAQLITHLDAKPAVLLGHSFGSVIAAEVAASRPDSVSHLVLLAAPGTSAHFPVRALRTATALLQHDRGRQTLRGPLRLMYRAGGFPSSLTDDELTCTTLDSGAADFAAYARALQRARQPTFIAWAVDDRQVPPRNSAALHSHAAPGPRVGFTSGGHNIQKTRAVELAAMIRAFVG